MSKRIRYCFLSAALLSGGLASLVGAQSGMNVAGSGFNFTLPDPKHPGKMLYNLRFAFGNGQMEADGFHGTMTKVWARLYQNGDSAAILTAPHAQGSSANKSTVITGTGGVEVKSLNPKGTVLTADTVTWYAKLNKIVATGHVYYKDGKTGGVLTGPYMTADTKLKAISVGPGHATVSL